MSRQGTQVLPVEFRPLRSNDKNFVTAQRPYSAASPQSVSRWIVEGIKAAGPEALTSGREPRVHDTRVSARPGPSEDLLKAAFWRSKNSIAV